MKRSRTLAWLPLLLLAGCGTLGDGDGMPAAVEDARSPGIGAALAGHARLRKLPPADLAREQENAYRAYSRARSDANRVRYALALAMPGATPADEAKALEALEPVVRNGNSSWNGIAVLVSGLLQEQRRRDSHAQDLQQKLDALLNLERNMIGRESGGARKR